MIETTRRATFELERLRQERHAADRQGIRLTRDADGQLRLNVDMPHDSDMVVAHDGTPLLITDRRVNSEFDGHLLHFRSDGDDRYGASGFVLLPRRSGSVRVA